LDVVENGVNGYLFKDTPEECAEAIMKCLESHGSMSRDARRIAETYSMEATGKKMIALYESIVSRKKRQ
jgi:glycosyltransferase involved in cell wall biosynthesis